MSVSWQGMSPETFAAYLQNATTETRREAKKRLYKGAKQIMHSSVMMTPVDEHNLEQAHKIETVRLNKDDMGIEITVGGMVGDEDVSAYAWVIHSGWGPNKDGIENQLGKKSQEKSDTNPDPYRGQVGPGFLDRAVEMHEDEIIADVADALFGI